MPALMRSELPELARTQHHWITLLRLPHRWTGGSLAVLALWAWIEPVMVLVLLVVIAAVVALRVQEWRAELIILTTQRIVRVRGVPESTTSEASLRLDRVSGFRMVQSVPGKILGYATVELEAPGDHPDVRRLVKIAHPWQFYDRLRSAVFDDARTSEDPDDGASEPATQRFPLLGPRPPADPRPPDDPRPPAGPRQER